MKVYHRMPRAAQNLAVSAQGLSFRVRRASTKDILRRFADLQLSERWSNDQFIDLQTKMLGFTLAHAFRTVPYYRDAVGGVPSDDELSRPWDLFGRLPVLSKDRVKEAPLRFVSSAFPNRKIQKGYTSGSTGTPMVHFFTREGFSQRWAFVARLRNWAGLQDIIYPRRAQFTGRDIAGSSDDRPYRVNYPGNALLLSTTNLREETIEAYVRGIRAWEPELIDGYPSALRILARLAKKKGVPLPRIPAIITSAETLDADCKVELEEAFTGRLFDQYAASEPSCFWSHCEYGRMHVHPEYGISEIVRDDGSPAAPGEEGRVILTCLISHVMPLIRYEVGDSAVVARDQSCPCGRQMLVIERVAGRRDDIVFVPERGYVGRLDPVFKGLDGIIETQIIQLSLDELVVKLTPDKGYTPAVESQLEQNLRAKVGNLVKIRIEKVDHIPRGANGKLRSVVSLVRDQYPVRM